jgi:hypothetical protein
MMIPAGLVGLSFVVMAAVEPNISPSENQGGRQLTLQQRTAVMRPLVRSATDCIVSAVAASPRFQGGMAPASLNDLIVASMTPCLASVRAMIEAHDRVFGDGSGEVFFMGTFLDVLPAAVTKQVKGEPK